MRNLFQADETRYGSSYKEHLFEQYKLYVHSAEKISDRRQKSNEFFLALNTAVITVIGFSIGKENLRIPSSFYILVSLTGVIICYFWYRIITSYMGLNGGKFSVIHSIESQLPLSLYETEWNALGEGQDKKKYWPFTHIELNIPWIFIIFYSSVFLKYCIPLIILIYPVLMYVPK